MPPIMNFRIVSYIFTPFLAMCMISSRTLHNTVQWSNNILYWYMRITEYAKCMAFVCNQDIALC